MGRFHGPQGKGAGRELRKRRRNQAIRRQRRNIEYGGLCQRPGCDCLYGDPPPGCVSRPGYPFAPLDEFGGR